MDTQLKQRLTGAVILVLLAVLFVPELLRGPRSNGSPSTATPQPAPEAAAAAAAEGAPLRSYEIDLSDTPRPSAEPAPAADGVAPPAAAVPGTPASASPAPAPARAPAPATQRSSPEPQAAAPTIAPALPPQRGFAVQVGSFASRDSADRLAGALRVRRFETFVSPVRSGSRQLYRVRVGPVDDRAAAQALAARLKSAGQKGSVVPLP